ncbi:UNVERIFIED_CONTAM: protein YLS3 [Sesamum angustifolium]|uniref:Protein YLS3 n=1 Tax=Sesamum angustifolium TaxID=2727405 RepID=A0AAW2N813_9LAMI
MDSCTRTSLFLTSTLILLVLTTSDNSKDRQECADSLGLATCLPYVGGTAKTPTPDCCSGLKQVLKTNKKCLCVVIKDRNDPDLGLNINVTLALGLPVVCNAPANISQCPGE